ncbi:MAG: DUF1583 domain-containing protein [Planctomycetaceae bacterium]|nr:DUF1583 domain-containing protein [Planctomycetaceae bacterium]
MRVPFRQALVIFLGILANVSCRGDDAANDGLARNAIFASQHVEESAWFVHERARQLDAGERFRLLRDWVLPSEQHADFRDPIDFRPTHQCETWNESLVSPLLDLIQVSLELHRLQELDDQFERLSRHNSAKIRESALAARYLVAVARHDDQLASQRLREFLNAVPFQDRSANGPSNSEWLVCWTALQSGNNVEEIADRFFAYKDWAARAATHQSSHRHWLALISLARPKAAEAEHALRSNQSQWRFASHRSAESNGLGDPVAHWDIAPGVLESRIGHDRDFAYFAVPLTGEFEWEGDIKAEALEQSEVVIHGHWTRPLDTLQGLLQGTYRRQLPAIPFDEPLTRWRHGWRHQRTTVGDGQLTTFVHGRPVYERNLDDTCDPWLAIRSSHLHDGAVRDLRITGTPTVPEKIELLSDPNLDNWLPYYEESVGNDQSIWRWTDGELVGVLGHRFRFSETNESLPCFAETLLRYHRPLFEDGIIDYEFFYDPGKTIVHPAIGRMVYLLTPDGVRLHQLTDGRFDRTGSDPANASSPPSANTPAKSLPLRPQQWNRMRLQLSDDTVTLVLNDEPIIREVLEPKSDRAFGLFYYRDQTMARVRHLTYRGDWPRPLPKPEDQLLWKKDANFPLDTRTLKESFTHDFAKEPAWWHRFSMLHREPKTELAIREQGLTVTRPGLGGFCNTVLAPLVEITGDFDITAEYDGFSAELPPGDVGTAKLMLVMGNTTDEEFSIARRHIHHKSGEQEQIGQSARFRVLQDRPQREYFLTVPMEERTGKLRLSRRGETLYYLTSEQDSPHFQVRGERPISREKIPVQGLQLVSQIYDQGGHIQVTWKRLDIQAETITGPAAEDSPVEIDQINDWIETLPQRFSRDFTKQGPGNDFFVRYPSAPWSADDDGWKFSAVGRAGWMAAGGQLLRRVAGDFDIRMAFQPESLANVEAPDLVAIYLQVVLADLQQTAYSLIFVKNPFAETLLLVEKKTTQANGRVNLDTITRVPIANIDQLRLVRRKKSLYFLATSETDDQEFLIAQIDAPSGPLANDGIRFLIHPGGEGQRSEIRFQSIDVRAESIDR